MLVGSIRAVKWVFPLNPKGQSTATRGFALVPPPQPSMTVTNCSCLWLSWGDVLISAPLLEDPHGLE